MGFLTKLYLVTITGERGGTKVKATLNVEKGPLVSWSEVSDELSAQKGIENLIITDIKELG